MVTQLKMFVRLPSLYLACVIGEGLVFEEERLTEREERYPSLLSALCGTFKTKKKESIKYSMH